MERGFLIVVSVFITIAGAYAHPNTPPVDECGFQLNYTLVHRFPEGKRVFGVQVIDKEVYIIRDFTPYIEVYDRDTFQPKRNISIEHLQRPYNLAQSRHKSSATSLFVIDFLNRVNLTVVKVPSGTVTQWSYKEPNETFLTLTGSSLYTGANILITTMENRKVKEFTPDGKLVSEVILRNISNPRQAIKVASDRYVVSHGYGPPPELHRVCLVDGNGEKIKCYGGDPGSGVGQLNTPGRMVLNKKNCIPVLDMLNRKVVLLNKDLKYVRYLIKEDLEMPNRLFLDEKQRLLYVTDNTVDNRNGRVKVFKI